MAPHRTGFIIESLGLHGAGKPAAELAFIDGLNVVSGASDTGKSFALGCIDYAFGARKLSRLVPQAKGYTTVVLKIRARGAGTSFEITRSIAGGDARVREVAANGEVLSDKALAAKHDANDTETLSGLLLGLCGLGARKLRKNSRGDLRSLSFRDVAFLILVEEERIISERPPHLSGSHTEATTERAALRLLATGTESASVIAVPKKKDVESARSKLDLLQQLDAKVTEDIDRLGVSGVDVEAEMGRIERARDEALARYEDARIELVGIEERIAGSARALREADARTLVAEGLEKRFELLRQHYDSDIARLEAVDEAGTLLESFPSRACPVCGAAPKDQRGGEADPHFPVDKVRAAAKKESAKVVALRADLMQVLGDLATEVDGLRDWRERQRREMVALQGRMNGDLQPRVRASAEVLREQTARRDTLLRARALEQQRASLRIHASSFEGISRGGNEVVVNDSAPTTGELEGLAQAVQELLREWNYPDAERVVFSEAEQDLVIGGQPRGTHGKGVRALSCAAFIAGLMRHCVGRQLPHPGVVLLDSPLVVYREPDARQESKALLQAGVKEAFYRSLAAGAAGGQVIIFENEDPPADVRINQHHFSKSGVGRYGFIPG